MTENSDNLFKENLSLALFEKDVEVFTRIKVRQIFSRLNTITQHVGQHEAV